MVRMDRIDQDSGRRTQDAESYTHHPRWSLSTSTLLQIVLFAGIFVLNFFQGTDVDMWWHLATGRYIVETGVIPQTDPFSYTAAGQPWVAHEWLAEIGMFLLYRSGGYLAMVVCFASLITLTYWLALRTLRTLGIGLPASVCITFWIAFMSMAGWHVRPQAFSYLFFSFFLYLLIRARSHNDRRLWLLPLTMVVWVNLHGGYIMGLILVGLFITGEGINRLRESRGKGGAERGNDGETRRGRNFLSAQHPAPNTQDAGLRARDSALPYRRLIAIAGATILAAVANPQGISMLLYPFTYAGTQNASMKFITEWQSPNFHHYFFFVFGASMMVLMIAPSRKPVDWGLCIPLLALTAMSLQSVRVIPFYAIVAAPVLGLRLAPPKLDIQNPEPKTQNQTQHSDQDAGPRTQDSGLRPRHSTPLNWLLLAVCLAAMFSTLLLTDRAQLGPEPRMGDFPTQGAQYIKDSGLQGNIFNTFHWGGYLIWFFYPERPVFVDGRPDMYGDPFMEKYRKIHDARPGWEQVLNEYQVDIALVEKDGRVATLLAASDEWEEVFRGEIELVFVRKAT
jgi:hypothetical protein